MFNKNPSRKNLQDADFDITKLVSCVVCSIQLPNKELLKKHLQEKHNMSPKRDVEGKQPVKKELEEHEKMKHADHKSEERDFKPMQTQEVHKRVEINGKAPPKLAHKQVSGIKLNMAVQNVKFSNIRPGQSMIGQPPLKKIKVNELSLELAKPTSSATVFRGINNSQDNQNDNSPWLMCTLCSFKTLKEISFIQHMHKNHNKFGDLEDAKQYSCRKCDSIFPSLLLFVGHKSKCKPIDGVDPGKKAKAFRCAICNERFLEASTMQNHVNGHTVKGPDGGKYYKCPCCKHVYKNPRLLVDHIKNNHRTDNISDNGDRGSSSDSINNEEKDPLAVENETEGEAEKRGTNKYNMKKENSYEDDPEIKELDDILNSFNNGNESLKERNKANIGSDDDGSDTSVDSDEDQERNQVKEKKKKNSYSCLYCHKGPKSTFLSKDSLMNHQKDIFGLRKNEKFFMRPHLNCPHCSFMIQCEVSMSQHLADKHQVPDKKCGSCGFETNMTSIMNHHITNNHKDNVIHRTCAVCGIVLRDKKNLTGHYYSKHNILDPSKLKSFQTP